MALVTLEAHFSIFGHDRAKTISNEIQGNYEEFKTFVRRDCVFLMRSDESSNPIVGAGSPGGNEEARERTKHSSIHN